MSGSSSSARLAPLYDVASVLPYPQFDVDRVKLAMKIGDKYRLREIGRREWTKLANEVKVNADELIAKLIHMSESLPDLITDLAHTVTGAGLDRTVIENLSTRLIDRARRCRGKLG